MIMITLHMFTTERNLYRTANNVTYRLYVSGGGLVTDGEFIQVMEVTLDEARALFLSSSSECINAPAGCLNGVSWFFLNIAPGLPS